MMIWAQVPKASGGDRKSQIFKNDSGVDFEKATKAEVIKNAGFTPKQAERFQTLAKHRDIVEQAKAEARENDDAGAKQRQARKEHYYTGERQRFIFTDKRFVHPVGVQNLCL